MTVQQNKQITLCLDNSRECYYIISMKCYLNKNIKLQKDIFSVWQRLINGSAYSFSFFLAAQINDISQPPLHVDGPCRLSSSQWNVNGSHPCHFSTYPLTPHPPPPPRTTCNCPFLPFTHLALVLQEMGQKLIQPSYSLL